MEESFVFKLDELRSALGFPMIVNSGYRCAEHPLEIDDPATHSMGIAADIRIYGLRCYDFVGYAIRLGFRGIGVDQKAGTDYIRRHVHLDTFAGTTEMPRPRIWSE